MDVIKLESPKIQKVRWSFKTMNKNRKLVLGFLCVFLIGLTAGVRIGIMGNGSPIIIYPEAFYKGHSYIFDRVDSLYYAIDGSTGAKTASTNFTALWDTTLDALPTEGGRIMLKMAYYEGWIVIDRDGVIVEGEGCWATQTDLISEDPPSALYGTVIKPPSGKNAIEITDWGDDESGKWKYGIQIRDLGIWFTTATTGHGITTGTPYNQTTVTNLVVENIKVLNNDKDHYALQLCNFLYSTFKNILCWKGPLLEIYANSEWLKQGNSLFDQLFCKISVDLEATEYEGPYPIFIHRNQSINPDQTWTNLCNFRRIQINNPVHQTGDRPSHDFYEAYLHDLRYSTFQELDLEGVNDNKVRVGSACHVTFVDSLLWTMDPGDAFTNVAYNTEYIAWVNCFHEDIMDGNYTNTYTSCGVYGDIDPATKAQFVGLEGNSGFATLLSGQTEINITCRYLGYSSMVFLTITESDTLEAGEALKIEAQSGATASFVVKCIDEGTASTDIGFYWEVTQIPVAS